MTNYKPKWMKYVDNLQTSNLSMNGKILCVTPVMVAMETINATIKDFLHKRKIIREVVKERNISQILTFLY